MIVPRRIIISRRNTPCRVSEIFTPCKKIRLHGSKPGRVCNGQKTKYIKPTMHLGTVSNFQHWVITMRTKQPFHIMVTDINSRVRDLLKRELEQDGYSVSCIRSGIDVYRSICDSVTVDLIILDPELLYPYGNSFLTDILDHNPPLQIILHTYYEYTRDLKTSSNVHIIEKNATSINPLKEKIRTCLGAVAK